MRLFLRPIKTGITELTGDQCRHAVKVMRLEPGDTVELFDGAGAHATATVQEISKKKLRLDVHPVAVIGPRTAGRIVLAVSMAKGDRFDWLIGKATELGADGIIPVLYERTVKQSRNPAARDRWQRLAISATQQCGRLHLPRIEPPLPLLEVGDAVRRDYPEAQWLTGSLTPDAQPILTVNDPQKDTVAWVGPEGGLTEEEETFLREAGAAPVRLTEHILRIETAGIAFATLLAAQRHASAEHV